MRIENVELMTKKSYFLVIFCLPREIVKRYLTGVVFCAFTCLKNTVLASFKLRATGHERQATNLPLCSYPLVCPLSSIICRLSTIYEQRTMNYELAKKLSYPAQFNIMLKYKNVKFLQHFAQKVRAFAYFCQLSDTFLHVFAPFFSCPFYPNYPCCQSTPVFRLKPNTLTRRTQKNLNFPPIFKI